MEFFISALAVYKLTQLVDALLPREPMPWVKLLFSVALGYAASVIVGTGNYAISGLAIAAVAGATHSVLRLVTLVGDMSQRRNTR